VLPIAASFASAASSADWALLDDALDESLAVESLDDAEAVLDAAVVDDVLSPLLSLAVCDAVSQAAKKAVAANIAIRR
jgi:hypothetical protein